MVAVRMGKSAGERYLLVVLQIPLAMIVKGPDAAFRITFVLELGEFSTGDLNIKG